MFVNEDGILLRSERYAFSLSSPIIIKPDFLQPALEMRAPEIAEIAIRIFGSVTATGGNVDGRDSAKLINNVLIVDDANLVNASGATLRVLEQSEYGPAQQDGPDITSTQTNANWSYTLRINFEPKKAHRSRDTRVPVFHLLNGGQFTITPASAAPTNYASLSLQCEVVVRVVDGRVPELKSRMEIWEQVVTQQEFYYPVNGCLRYAILTSRNTTTGYTDLDGLTALNSITLKYPPSFNFLWLRDRYLRMSDAFATDDEAVGVGTEVGAIHLMTADRNQRIGAMAQVGNLHLDLGTTAPTNARLLVVAIRNRTARLAALVAGFGGDIASYQQALLTRGRVVDGKPGGTPVQEYNPDLVARLPVRIPGMAA